MKTRNKYQVSGLLNPTYNIKRGADVLKLADLHRADLAWVAIQVIPERQVISAYFGTIEEIEEQGERFSIPMREFDTLKYECLTKEEIDKSLRMEWSNGGYARSRADTNVNDVQSSGLPITVAARAIPFQVPGH